ncbi:uncharacterized protein FIBRA_05575 [Fibroporia radiculosa]|uniref:Uncharacterized protein n=1 Tax=Fibroporia radiculosa TaxID=599839 RepID=J4HXS1_9APHY|nr:uncharacterized protein FIBRA_05575 [Fibroporia radiculosa]CCM03442.1 predicted protein [Fibroporia radiculosa]
MEQPSDSFSSSIAEALGEEFEVQSSTQAPLASASLSKSSTGLKQSSMNLKHNSYSPPPPVYSPLPSPPHFDSLRNGGNGTRTQQPPSGGSHEDSSGNSREHRRVMFEDVQDTKRSADEDTPTAEIPSIDHDISGIATSEPKTVQRGDTSAPPIEHDLPEPRAEVESTIPPAASDDPMDEQSLNAAAAREVSRELDVLMFNASSPPAAHRESSPIPSPRSSFARPPISLRPSMEISTSLPGSPRVEAQYIRTRDRSAASPTSISSGGQASAIPSVGPTRYVGDDPSPSPILPGSSLARASSPPQPPPTVAVSPGTPYRTPPEGISPASSQINAPMYSLPPAMTGSGASFSQFPTSGGKISAAAFRRQQQLRSMSSPTVDNSSGGPVAADTSPLVVKKRPLPQLQHPAQRPGQGTPRMPSAPLTVRNRSPTGDPAEPDGRYRTPSAVGVGNRVSQEGGGSDDDYDYISAYVNTSEQGPRSEDGYEQGRYATRIENGSGDELR